MDFAKVLILALPSSLAVAAGCSSSNDAPLPPPAPPELVDAAAEGGAVDDDAGASPPTRDAGFVDVDPLPIECTAPPCARALVTTFSSAAVTTGGQGFCALLDDGTVACWGDNSAGQLGRGEPAGTLSGSSVPRRVAGLGRVVDLEHTCAVDEDGATWCWGTSRFLQDADVWKRTTQRIPVRIPVPPADTVAISLDLGCVGTRDGRILCWGGGSSGQVGALSEDERGPTEIPMPPGPRVRKIAVGYSSFFTREDGTTLSVGLSQTLGRVSSHHLDPTPAPIAVERVQSLDVAMSNVCAAARGRGYCWGSQLPRSLDNYSRSYPSGLVIPEPIVDIATTPTVSFDDGVTVPYRWCAVAASGAVYCWGYNESGQAGTGTKEYVNDAARVAGLPAPAVSVKITRSTSCALLTTGKVHCWGSNYDGQLGNGRNRGVALVPEEVLLP